MRGLVQQARLVRICRFKRIAGILSSGLLQIVKFYGQEKNLNGCWKNRSVISDKIAVNQEISLVVPKIVH